MSESVICITGGASGMGLATARKFDAEGWRAILIDLSEHQLQQAKQALSTRTVTIRADVTQESDMKAAMETVRDATEGRLDILFNNAGIAPGGLLESQDTATIRAILDVNVLGVIFSIRAAMPMLKATPNALCISTSSSVATYGHATRSVYSASKFAVKGLTEALSLELEGDDIRVADVLPGCIDTPLLREELAKGSGQPFTESMLERLPQSGAYRLLPDTAIADAVWSAYENADQIHFYVPEEIGNTDKVKAHDIQAAKEEIREFLFRPR